MNDFPAAAPGPLRAFLALLTRYAGDWLEDRRYRDEHQRFIDELESTGNLESFLEALGATRQELCAWAISPIASAALLDRMMLRAGVTREQIAADPALRDDLQRVCRCCASWQRCRRWLRDDKADEAYREFCPNADVLARMRAPALPSS